MMAYIVAAITWGATAYIFWVTREPYARGYKAGHADGMRDDRLKAVVEVQKEAYANGREEALLEALNQVDALRSREE